MSTHACIGCFTVCRSTMDMGLAYQCAVKQWLPNTDIVFDRFHVMQMYRKALTQVRRALFKAADGEGKEMLKGSRYLILPNKCNLNETQQSRLETLLAANARVEAGNVAIGLIRKRARGIKDLK